MSISKMKMLQAKHKDWDGTAEAIWKFREGEWQLMQASPAIDFLETFYPEEAVVELKERGWTFKWL